MDHFVEWFEGSFPVIETDHLLTTRRASGKQKMLRPASLLAGFVIISSFRH
jgi:hypothetical protein